ncbi:hypothetical protein [Alcanivorax sp.]|uniref:hypothetical protein n=1 Tax=Alcanivorax sp. TaxID=1872427 RepID=UPI003BA89247
MENQIAFIDRTRQQLPAMVDNLNAEIRQLHEQAMTQLKSSHKAVQAVLENTYQAYYGELRKSGRLKPGCSWPSDRRCRNHSPTSPPVFHCLS